MVSELPRAPTIELSEGDVGKMQALTLAAAAHSTSIIPPGLVVLVKLTRDNYTV